MTTLQFARVAAKEEIFVNCIVCPKMLPQFAVRQRVVLPASANPSIPIKIGVAIMAPRVTASQ